MGGDLTSELALTKLICLQEGKNLVTEQNCFIISLFIRSQGSADPKTDRSLVDIVPCCRELVEPALANLIEGPRVL